MAISWVDRPLRRAMLTNAASPPYFNIEQETARSTFSIWACNELRCCRRRRRRRTETGKIHCRRSLRSLLRRKKRFRRKPKHSSNYICWKSANRRVEVLDRRIEIISLDRDAVFRSFELRLQFPKILRRAKFRIALAHQQQTRKGITQLPLRSLKLLQLRRVGWCLSRIQLHPPHARPGVRHFGQSRFLEISRACDSVDEVRNQIRAALVNRLHIAPPFVDFLIQRDEAIVAASQREGRNDNDEEQDSEHHAATECEFVHNLVNGSGNVRPSQSHAKHRHLVCGAGGHLACQFVHQPGETPGCPTGRVSVLQRFPKNEAQKMRVGKSPV